MFKSGNHIASSSYNFQLIRETVKSSNMRLTLVVILIVSICTLIADGKPRGRGRRRFRVRRNNMLSRENQPVPGNWGSWSIYDVCSVTCDGGIQKRHRLCNNPVPKYGGRHCTGSNQEKRHCNESPCPVDGIWGAWSQYSCCSVTCGTGTQKRTRVCDNPPAAHGGQNCTGDDESIRNCNSQDCPEPSDGIRDCNPGFTGSVCEIDLCADKTCGNPDGCCRIRPVPESPDCGETCVGRQQLACIYGNCKATVCDDGLTTCYDASESSCVLLCSEPSLK